MFYRGAKTDWNGSRSALNGVRVDTCITWQVSGGTWVSVQRCQILTSTWPDWHHKCENLGLFKISCQYAYIVLLGRSNYNDNRRWKSENLSGHINTQSAILMLNVSAGIFYFKTSILICEDKIVKTYNSCRPTGVKEWCHN